MSLDVKLAVQPPVAEYVATGISFEHDAYYWFLHPLFEKLAERTGEMIDLYGYATFQGRTLEPLGEILAEASRLVESQPATWPVYTGERLENGTRVPMFVRAEKECFRQLIGAFEQLIDLAKRYNGRIDCVGD